MSVRFLTNRFSIDSKVKNMQLARILYGSAYCVSCLIFSIIVSYGAHVLDRQLREEYSLYYWHAAGIKGQLKWKKMINMFFYSCNAQNSFYKSILLNY